MRKIEGISMQNNHHIGRLVRPINFRNIDNQNMTSVAYVRLAVDGMTGKQTTFLDYVAFGKLADILSKKTMEKGDLVEIQFTIQNNNFVDQVTQKKIFNTQNVISQIKVYPNKNNINRDDSSTSSPSYPSDLDSPVNHSESSENNPFYDYETYTS